MSIRRQIQKHLQEGSTGLVKKTYEIEASPHVIEMFEDFLCHVQWCSGVGHSCTVGMPIDGDGADRFKVLSPDVRDREVEHENPNTFKAETVRARD